MKSLFFCVLLLVAKLGYTQAWNEKSNFFQIGIGESHTFKTHVEENKSLYTSINTSNMGNLKIKTTPTIFLKFERALNKYIGLGMVFGYRRTDITQTIGFSYYDTTVAYPSSFGGYYYMQKTANDIFKFKINDINIGARINVHFLIDKKIDPYIGLAAGYRLFNRDYEYDTDYLRGIYYVVEYKKISPIYFGGSVGIKYHFTNDIGIYTEIGFDKRSIIQGGIVFKMR